VTELEPAEAALRSALEPYVSHSRMTYSGSIAQRIPDIATAVLAAAVPHIERAIRDRDAADGPHQYLTTYNCDDTVAAHWKRGLIQPRRVPRWELATAEEVASAEFRCPYCASVYDGPAQCYVYDECATAGVAARGGEATE